MCCVSGGCASSPLTNGGTISSGGIIGGSGVVGGSSGSSGISSGNTGGNYLYCNSCIQTNLSIWYNP